MPENALILCFYLKPCPTRHTTPQNSPLNSASPQNVKDTVFRYLELFMQSLFTGSLIISSLYRLVSSRCSWNFFFFTATLKFPNNVSECGSGFFHHAGCLVGRPFRLKIHIYQLWEVPSFFKTSIMSFLPFAPFSFWIFNCVSVIRPYENPQGGSHYIHPFPEGKSPFLLSLSSESTILPTSLTKQKLKEDTLISSCHTYTIICIYSLILGRLVGSVS